MQRFTVLALHRRAGKTELAIMQLIDRAMQFDKDLGLFFYVAPFLKQGKAIAWSRLKQRVSPLIVHGAVEVNESELSVRFAHNSAVIRIYGGDNPDGMRGVRLDGAVIDEVAQIKPTVWEDILQPALADRKGWALFIGTPDGVNLFSELFYRGQQLRHWYSAKYTCYDTDALDPTEIERMRSAMSETSFAREMLCDFSAAGVDQLISLSDLEAAARRVYAVGSMDYAPRIVGVDPARFGDDRSVIVRRQGLQMFEPMTYRGLDNMELAAKVAQVIADWEPEAVFIDVGNGSGVIDRLRQLGHDVTEVNFGGRSTQAVYVNKRTEMWFGIREWLALGGAIPNSVDLKQDLGAPTFHYDAANRAALESKDDIKKRGLPSPDLGDALALTFAMPVAKRRTLPSTRPGPMAYDPLEQFSCLTSSGRDYSPLDLVR